MQDLVGHLTLEEMVAQMSHGGVHVNGVLVVMIDLYICSRTHSALGLKLLPPPPPPNMLVHNR